MTDEEKVRENLVRRMLYRQGYALSKSKTRDSRAWDYGVYLITHILAGYDSGVVAAYCRSLDEAEKWALEGDRAAELEDASGRPEEDWEEIATVGAGWLGQAVGAGGYGPYPVKVLRGSDGGILFIKVDSPDGAPAYLAKIPAPPDVPAGRVVVHNQVRPTRRLGFHGFRAWLAEPGDKLTACSCDWAPELGTHYRVAD